MRDTHFFFFLEPYTLEFAIQQVCTLEFAIKQVCTGSMEFLKVVQPIYPHVCSLMPGQDVTMRFRNLGNGRVLVQEVMELS